MYALNGYTQAIVYAVEEGKKISNQNTTSATVEKKTQKKKHALTTSVQQKVKKYQHTTLTELQIPGDGKKSKKFLARISKDTEFRAANGSDIFP